MAPLESFLFWLSDALLPVNLYFIAFGTISPAMNAAAAAINVVMMIQIRESAR